MKIIKRGFEIIIKKGVRYIFKRILSENILKQLWNYSSIQKLFFAKFGLEVGGPSKIFRDGEFLPLYKIVKEIDGCNFSNITLWEGQINKGKTYNYYENKKGVQWVSEATDLSFSPNSKYDFVISSNCLEHVANPLKAIGEFIRVIKINGLILLVLPNKQYNFDHNRSNTEFIHLLNDLRNDIKEDDLTHFEEILSLHDLDIDRSAGSISQFKERSFKNFENRALHHHVFNLIVLKEIFRYFKLKVLITYEGTELIILGKKIIE